LEEYRAATISEAVTGRIDVRTGQPYPAYKPSGIKWLGDIPAHWEVTRLGNVLSSLVGGGTPSTSNSDYWAEENEDGVPWIAIGDMSQGGTVVTTKKRITQVGRVSKALQPLPPGTIIYSMYASVGVVARLGITAVTNQAILGLIPDKRLHSPFLHYWLAALRRHVLALTRSSTQDNLNAGIVRTLPLNLPPLVEQAAIAHYIDSITSKVDTAIANTRREIELLEEYRTRLIADVVTGQVDVREAAALIEAKQEAAQ